MSTDTLKAHEAVFISRACKSAIKLLMGDLPIMKQAFLEAKKARMKTSPDFSYWEGSAATVEAILSTAQRYMYADIREMGMDRKMLYMMYGAQEYANYYQDVIDGIREPLIFEYKKEEDDEY